MTDCASDPGVEKESGTEGRNEGKSAAYDTESNPAISCTPSQSCAALSIYGNGIYTKGNPGLMDQGCDRNSFVLTSGKRLARRDRFLDEPSVLRGSRITALQLVSPSVIGCFIRRNIGCS